MCIHWDRPWREEVSLSLRGLWSLKPTRICLQVLKNNLCVHRRLKQCEVLITRNNSSVFERSFSLRLSPRRDFIKNLFLRGFVIGLWTRGDLTHIWRGKNERKFCRFMAKPHRDSWIFFPRIFTALLLGSRPPKRKVKYISSKQGRTHVNHSFNSPCTEKVRTGREQGLR